MYYTSYSYDAAGRLATVSTSPNSNMSGATQEASYQYFASGKIKQVQLGNGQQINYKYNERDWLTSDSSNQFWEHIGYNVSQEIGGTVQYNGNISWITYYIAGLTYPLNAPLSPSNLVGYSFGYDGANRMTNANFGYQSSPGSWQTVSSYAMAPIGYDNNGNITGLQRYGSGTSVVDNLVYTYTPGTNKLAQIWNQANNFTSIYSYDANGNVTSDGYHGITNAVYNIDNLPTTMTVNATQDQYYYDADGNRIKKYDGTTNTYYVVGSNGETEAVKSVQGTSTNITYNILATGDNIGQVRITGTVNHYYYLKDHLGDIKMTVDANGTPQVWNDYYPFGDVMPGRSRINGGPDPRYQFTGKEQDVETTLDYFGARYYDSWRGQWLSSDPMTQGSSMYDYCSNDPMGTVDPNGSYSYTIDGAPVSDEIGQTLMDEANVQQHELEQQHQNYQTNQIIQNLSAGDQDLLTALGAAGSSPRIKNEKLIAGIMFTVFNRLAKGHGGAKSINDVIYADRQYDEINTQIFQYATGDLPSSKLTAYEIERFNQRIGWSKDVLNGIMNGSILNPVGGSMFYHALDAGTWNTEPWRTYVRDLNAIYLLGGEATPAGWEQYFYGNTVFINWTGIK